jgi:LuxR family transcriptional regulator, maltose regulon positive regulatory protein
MPAGLLTTKFYFPPTRENLVSRPRLIERLTNGLRTPLTLVSAPAGYGKTTLLSEWRAGVGKDVPAAWLLLDSGDNDLSRFLNHLAAAFESIKQGLVQNTSLLLKSPQPFPNEVIVTSLVNDLSIGCSSDFSRGCVLVLDDYHTITFPGIHEVVSSLIANLPPLVHLVILTRSDPPLPLSRLRARNQIIEIRAEHLRFTLDEGYTFMKQVMGIELKDKDIAILEARSEGWIAGLQLVALSLQGRNERQISEFIKAFSGSHHYIVDYLSEEVLQRQPEVIRSFLVQTSILESLSGPLCDAVLELSSWSVEIDKSIQADLVGEDAQLSSQRILEYLDRSNLFLISLDEERCWYRYHNLFIDLLSQKLRTLDPDHVAFLHQRASLWYQRYEYTDKAIYHTLAAKDWHRAIDLIDDASENAMQRGEIHKIMSWINALPKTVALKSPRLFINASWATVFEGHFDETEKMLTEIKPNIRNNEEFKSDWLAVQVWLARGRGQLSKAVELAKKALEYPESENPRSRYLLMFSLSFAYWHLGKIKETGETALEAIRLAEQVGNWHIRVLMLARLALVQAAQGQLHKAYSTYNLALTRGVGVPVWAGGGAAQHCLAALYYEWNLLDKAKELAQMGLEYSQLSGHAEFQVNSLRQLAYIYQAQGLLDKANEALFEADQVFHEHQLPAIFWGIVAASHVQIALAQGDLDTAVYWSKQVQGGYSASFHYLKLPLEQAKIALAQGDKATAARILADRYQTAVAERNRYAQIEIRILQALSSEDEKLIVDYIGEALTWAQEGGFIRIFLDQGKDVTPLLQKAARKGICIGYVSKLWSEFGLISNDIADGAQALIEPLSKRELQVIHLLAAGKSNQEIATELMIAVGTVKKHLNNIFSKLDVQNRTQCVARARELDLI